MRRRGSEVRTKLQRPRRRPAHTKFTSLPGRAPRTSSNLSIMAFTGKAERREWCVVSAAVSGERPHRPGLRWQQWW